MYLELRSKKICVNFKSHVNLIAKRQGRSVRDVGNRLSLTTLTFLLSNFACASGAHPPSYFEVHGHRGARARRPENSLQAFKYAVESGVTALELDLGVTKDNYVVINHDFTVETDRCKSEMSHLAHVSHPLIHDLTLAEVKSYNCATKNPDFPDQVLVPGQKVRIPAFKEFLYLLQNANYSAAKKVQINIETKIEEESPANTVDYKTFVDLIMKDLKHADFPLSRVILESFDFRTIIYAKSKWPKMRSSALINRAPSGSVAVEKYVRDIFAKTDADYLSPNGKICSVAMVNAVRSLKKKTLVWTINKQADWRHFAKIGADGVISDDPAAVIADMF
jgi:glycerophosphoryl diester phosphodiesterase